MFTSSPGKGSKFSFIIEEIENESNYRTIDLHPEMYYSS